jgi:hypothetical protein
MAAAPASAHVFVVRGDIAIGTYRVRADGSFAGALEAFGEPTSRRHTHGRGSCRATWPQHGLTIDFYNLGGEDACGPLGRFSTAFLRGRHWMTSKKLSVGDSVRKLRRVYPSARLRRGLRGFIPTGYWLVTRTTPIGTGGAYPGLLAETRAGRVVGLQLRYPAGGD